MTSRLARLRVPLGFVCALVAVVLARPTWPSWRWGLLIACAGELLRVWAAGHIDKGREITRSGPYRFVRHPLYLGSTIMGAGFAIAARHPLVLVLTVGYLALTFVAAMRSEEVLLDTQFKGAYTEYRLGQSTPADKPFSWRRATYNREHLSVLGLVVVFVFLALRAA